MEIEDFQLPLLIGFAVLGFGVEVIFKEVGAWITVFLAMIFFILFVILIIPALILKCFGIEWLLLPFVIIVYICGLGFAPCMVGAFVGAMVREAFDCIADEIRGRKAHKKFLDEHPEIKYGYPVVMDPDEFRKNRAGDDSAGKDSRN